MCMGFNYGPVFCDKAIADKYTCQDECGAGEAGQLPESSSI